MMPGRLVVKMLALALLALLGSTLQARQPDRWLEVRSPHVVVISNAGEEHARGVSQQFERVRALLRRVLTNARVDPRDPVVVLAVNNERRLREPLPQFWERKGQRPDAQSVKAFTVGGYAVAFHAKPRFMKNIDLFVEPTADNAQRLFPALKDFGFG